MSKKTTRAFLVGLLFVVVGFFVVYAQNNSNAEVAPIPAGKLRDLGNKPFNFLLLGHLYGFPNNRASVYPASTVLASIDLINSLHPEFVVLLGDSYRGTDVNHINLLKESFINKVSSKFIYVAGNHELKNRNLYLKHFGPEYYSFSQGPVYLIVFDSGLIKSNVSEDQQRFLEEAFEDANEDDDIKHIMILSHKMLWIEASWAEKINLYHNLLGGSPHIMKENNFTEDIYPILRNTHKKVYWVSGDYGFPILFHREPSDGITYIQTGIGNQEEDNMINVKVDTEGNLSFVLLSLTKSNMLPIEKYGVGFWQSLKRNKFNQLNSTKSKK